MDGAVEVVKWSTPDGPPDSRVVFNIDIRKRFISVVAGVAGGAGAGWVARAFDQPGMDCVGWE